QASAPTLEKAQELADGFAAQIERKLGTAVFSRAQEPLAAVVGRMLADRGQSLAVAESCTGGMVGERLTASPGASRFFRGAVVSYSNEVKQELLGVLSSTLQEQGAVSAACAAEMAAGVRQRLGADWGLSITGVAGPDGGTPDKPVGTVFIGL